MLWRYMRMLSIRLADTCQADQANQPSKPGEGCNNMRNNSVYKIAPLLSDKDLKDSFQLAVLIINQHLNILSLLQIDKLTPWQ